MLVNNTGISVVGAAEDTTEEDTRKQMETNLWGAVNVINAVLPHMRDQKKGHLINVNSLAGLFAIPYQASQPASMPMKAITKRSEWNYIRLASRCHSSSQMTLARISQQQR